MDPNVYALTFPAFVVIFAGLVWWWVKRQLEKSDGEQAKREEAIQRQFDDLKEWMQKQGDRLRTVEIELERRATKEELRQEFRDLRQELKEDAQVLQSTIVNALAGLK